MGRVAEQLAEVRASIAGAARDAARDPAGVRLIAVSKGQPASAIREAFDAGQRDFGENYAQELSAKARALADLAIRWHFIGHLQRNKVKDVLANADVVHTIDRAALADEISKRATRDVDVLLEVNVAAEPQKPGAALADVAALADHVATLPRLRLVGLMTVPPDVDDPREARPHFEALRAALDAVRARGHASAVELSMGMSHDYAVAIAAGATWVRVGTAIFGPRAPKQGT
jgi:hypothetical protein